MLHTRVSGAWRQVAALHTRVSGTWRSVSALWARVSGSWELVFAPIVLQDHSITVSGSTKGGGTMTLLTIHNDGDLTWEASLGVSGGPSPAIAANEWNGKTTKTAGEGDPYHVRLVDLDDHGVVGADNWVALTDDVAFFIGSATTTSVEFDLEFSADGGSSVIASARLTFGASVT